MRNEIKRLTPAGIDREVERIVSQAERQRRGLTNSEALTVKELYEEKARKESLRSEALMAEARKAGPLTAVRQAIAEKQKGLTPTVLPPPKAERIVSRSNQPDKVDRSDSIRARHARLKAGQK